MKNIKENFIYYLLLVIGIILFFSFKEFISWSDASSSWYSPFYNLQNLLYAWDTYNWVWSYWINNFTSFFLRLFYSLGEFINSSPAFIQKFSWITFFSISWIIIFNIINKITNNKLVSLSFVFFLFFNPISLWFLWSKQHWAYYLIVPYFISVYLYTTFYKTQNIKNLIYISFIWFIFWFWFNQPAYIVPLFLIFFIIFLYNFITRSDKLNILIKNIFFWIIFLLLNYVYIFPLLLWWTDILDGQIENFSQWNKMDMFMSLSYGNFFQNAFFNISRWNWTLIFDNIFLLLWIIFVIISLFYLLVLKSNFKINSQIFWSQFKIPFLIILLVFIFLLKWLNPPFADLSFFVYDIKVMYMFRDYIDKFSIWYITILSFLILIILVNFKSYKYYFYVITLTSCVLFIWNYWFPSHYKQPSDTLLNYKEIQLEEWDYKILAFPLVDYSFFKNTQPYYFADSPFKNLLQKDIIYTTDLRTIKPIYNLKQSLYTYNFNINDMYNIMDDFNIKYILINKNAIVPEDGELSWTNYYQNINELYKSKKLQKIYDNKIYSVLLYNDFSKLITGWNIDFYKINNIKYNVNLKKLNYENISFKESFNKNWKLYISNYKNKNIFNKAFFEWEELSYLYKKPLFENTHHLVYDYANWWNISKDEIIKYVDENYSKELQKEWYPKQIANGKLDYKYYVLNSDGSIDVELTLYFKPQSYFYLGLIISGTTFIILVWYLTISYIRNRKEEIISEID